MSVEMGKASRLITIFHVPSVPRRTLKRGGDSAYTRLAV